MAKLTIEHGHEGERLDRFLADNWPRFSRSALQRLIENGGVSVNGGKSRRSYKLRAGDVVEVALAGLELLEGGEVAPVDYPLEILHEDEHLIVVNKPPGLLTHPARAGDSPTLVGALLYLCGKLSDLGDPFRRGIVHRLDKDTSGAIVAAKNDAAHQALSDQFRDRRVSKRYVAVVHGAPDPAEGEINMAIGRDARSPEKMAIRLVDGRRAISHYQVVERFDGFSLVNLHPRTGRTHQLRVHISAIGHPVAADPLYGREKAIYASDLRGAPRSSGEAPLIARQALHAAELIFTHPITGEPMTFTAPIPPDMQSLIYELKDIG